ncbi:hypothetical protein [Yinghuangia sp. YIM S10712]|uniref:hypothetical protein n=1 Tax=Yinghuangia sp. YIM S10712 TaxID=3436930 RepID=UPI003F530AF0
MDRISPQLAGVVFGFAGPDLTPTLVARLGRGYFAPTDAVDGADAKPPRPDPRADTPRVLTGPVPDRDHQALPPEERARRPDLTGVELRRLLDLDDPRVDARLFVNPRLDDNERRRMLSGMRRDGSRTRVGAALLDLLWTTDTRRLRRLLPPALTSGDPGVAEAIVSRLELRSDGGRLRLVIAVWERHGRTAARRVLDAASFPATTTELIDKALARPSGLDDLRRHLAADEAPEKLAGRLRRHTNGNNAYVAQLVAEGCVLPWDALLRSHRTDPFPRALHVSLAEQPDCPRPLLLDLLAVGVSTATVQSPWLDDALAQGRLTPVDVLAHAQPAVATLDLLVGDGFRDRRIRWKTATAHPSTRDLFRARLGTNPDAWAVAVRLLPEFVGSISALLTTAAAATRTEAV